MESMPMDGGIVLGCEMKRSKEQIYYVGEDAHVICIGATRSGKSRCIVLPSIGLIGLAKESMVISDPKGELCDYTAPYLRNLGYNVQILDFKSPQHSHRYNFLQRVIDAIGDGDVPRAIDAAWDITSSLVKESRGEPIWQNGEAAVIAGSILAVVAENTDRPELQNMTNVYLFISGMCRGGGGDGELPLSRFLDDLPSNHPARAPFGVVEVAPGRTRASFFTAALTTLRLFTSPLIYGITERSEIDMRSIGRVPTALFIILPDERTTYYSLAALFINQLYEALVLEADSHGGRLARRVNLLLDEFGNFAAIPGFATKLTVGGGRGIRFNLFVQSLAQLNEKYGNDNAKTIIGNCQYWIYLQTEDPETLKILSEKLGHYTVASSSQSSSYNAGSGGLRSSGGSSSFSTNLMGRALLTPDEIRLLERPYTLVTSRNRPAIMYTPDLSAYAFNRMFGLGDHMHNQRVREWRQRSRPINQMRTNITGWGIWERYQGQRQTTRSGGRENHNANLWNDFVRGLDGNE